MLTILVNSEFEIGGMVTESTFLGRLHLSVVSCCTDAFICVNIIYRSEVSYIVGREIKTALTYISAWNDVVWRGAIFEVLTTDFGSEMSVFSNSSQGR
jgi:hypothetical protein